MVTTVPDTMANVERRRVQLEENVTKLRQSLKNWRSWELEYEMLKEEIQNGNSPSPRQILEIGRTLGGQHINEREVEDLLGRDRQNKRTADQVVDLISRRVDYVQQNISTVEKQLENAEKKLAGASVLLEPDMENEEGLPLMDIQEELDEEGNIISSSVQQPGKAAPEIVEALRKSGLKGVGHEDGGSKTYSTPPSDAPSVATSDGKALAHAPQPAAISEPNTTVPVPAGSKKSVSFAEDVEQVAPHEALSGRQALRATGYNENLADYNFNRGTKVIELDDDDEEIAQYPIIPQDESPEAAALRRQMLQYGLSEVGQVVAEINLDAPGGDYSDGEMDNEYDVEYDSDEESEEEDQYGRSTRREVTHEYRQQMMELEKKLNARMMENVGPRPDMHPLAEHADDVRRLVVRKDEQFRQPIDTAGSVPATLESKKKGVRFAESLDISSAPEPIRDQPLSAQTSAITAPTISETIVESTGSAARLPVPPAFKPTKVSRFKSARTTVQTSFQTLPTPPVHEQPPIPQGPPGRTLANSIVEKGPEVSAPQAPDEFDPASINREIQVEYHKMRNKFIQGQSSFKPTEEDEFDPIMEEKDGKVRKVSRFRAARLKAEGL
ncbi:hypothetical protein CC78DRAFT_528826 [Lojkania enalia]|uniref:DUF3835 domain-containing protein n=1 Tax=Lojkania enalia TaxID=147567 RepID=A0A9P4NAH1_9PLEO|nr:hypothetical protein CC78DRAFT_528826 [Didymosphaeria enalia]